MSIKLNLIGKYRWKGNNAKDYNVNNPLGKKRLRERERYVEISQISCKTLDIHVTTIVH